MGTTLKLDEDVARGLKARARRSGRSVSRVANELLRAGLHAEQQAGDLTEYDPPALHTGRPLLDVSNIGARAAHAWQPR